MGQTLDKFSAQVSDFSFGYEHIAVFKLHDDSLFVKFFDKQQPPYINDDIKTERAPFRYQRPESRRGKNIETIIKMLNKDRGDYGMATEYLESLKFYGSMPPAVA